ncbi:MAG: MerR family transcriptional regulator [Deinococcales bacterium]|nr:MerR family transcriptional regulator [Chitinophagaceae bacterium]
MLEQLDLFGNPVLVSTAQKEQLILEQQPLFEEASAFDQPQNQLSLFNESIATTTTLNAPVTNKIDAFKIEKNITPTELFVPKTEVLIVDITDNFVYIDNNIRVKVKSKLAKPVVEESKTIPAKKSVAESVSNLHKKGRKSYKDAAVSADLINIPSDDILNQKLYYGISEVATWFNVNVSQIRFWENEFDILQPRKTKKGDRLFRVADIKNLEIIYHLIRQRKFSIEGAKAYLKSNKQDVDTNFKLVQSLTKFRSFLLELKANLGT